MLMLCLLCILASMTFTSSDSSNSPRKKVQFDTQPEIFLIEKCGDEHKVEYFRELEQICKEYSRRGLPIQAIRMFKTRIIEGEEIQSTRSCLDLQMQRYQERMNSRKC